MNGFAIFHRQILDWEWYTTPGMLQLMFHLVIKANHKDGRWQGMEIKRGQLVTGRKKLSQETGLSEQTIRTCLKRLKSTNEITTTSTSKFTIITVCKYNEYQEVRTDSNQQTNQQLTNNQPATNQQLTTNNKNNNKNNKELLNPMSEIEPLPDDEGENLTLEDFLSDENSDTEPAKRKAPTRNNYNSAFEEFWKYYRENRHTTPPGGKENAYKAYLKIIKTGVDHAAIMKHTTAYLRQCSETDTKSKHAERFLKQTNFRDETEQTYVTNQAEHKKQKLTRFEQSAVNLAEWLNEKQEAG